MTSHSSTKQVCPVRPLHSVHTSKRHTAAHPPPPTHTPCPLKMFLGLLCRCCLHTTDGQEMVHTQQVSLAAPNTHYTHPAGCSLSWCCPRDPQHSCSHQPPSTPPPWMLARAPCLAAAAQEVPCSRPPSAACTQGGGTEQRTGTRSVSAAVQRSCLGAGLSAISTPEEGL